ncbi:CBS domain [Dillenia turbinata]|uniref:CBS domain n=1 Tax=Dillenia turbinata TaxID=194707 RepID=A0AAN8WD31_9MAGN
MDSVSLIGSRFLLPRPSVSTSLFSSPSLLTVACHHRQWRKSFSFRTSFSPLAVRASATESFPLKNGTRVVADFMTKKKDLHVLKTTTTVDEALETLVEKRITGFPVIDEDGNLVGLVSDYDLLALDSVSGGGLVDADFFPDVDSSWNRFKEIRKLLPKTNGKVIGDLMTPAPLFVCETTLLEDAARLLLETKYHRLPVIDSSRKLVGVINREDIVRAALEIKSTSEKET